MVTIYISNAMKQSQNSKLLLIQPIKNQLSASLEMAELFTEMFLKEQNVYRKKQ